MSESKVERTAATLSAVLPIEASNLHRSYVGVTEGGAKSPELSILRGVNIAAAPGEAVAIVGASGSGKSTLLHILGALDRPTRGSVCIGGIDIARLDSDALAALRNRHIGFVFQFHHLLQDFTALENVMMPALIRGDNSLAARKRAVTLLKQVNLGERLGHKPFRLSGGEQQRVAVARALVNQPLLVLADEPTGNLDVRTSDEVHDLLFDLKERHEVAMVVVTHNRQLAAKADRVLELHEGVLEDVRNG